MNLNQLVNEISLKYNYDDELKQAILITIPLMVEEYGEDSLEDIIKLFKNTRIFSTPDMGYNNRKKIADSMTSKYNSHIKSEETDPYQNGNSEPGSYYSYETIYDQNMNIVGEARWIVVKDMKDEINGQDYKQIFGTTINMPYFIHEINHAFAMQNAIYTKQGNQITSKHGMYEQVYSFSNDGESISLTEESNSHIILEEAMNEKITQDMLVSLLQAKDYTEVTDILKSINHITTSYSVILITLIEKLEKIMGKEKLLSLRKDNDMSVITEFNSFAKESEIAQKYIKEENPFNYFSKKCFELFRLKCEGYKMSIDEYEAKSKELMVEAFIPLCAYQNQKLGTIDLEKFDEIRNNILGIETTKKL